jgi:hypothetical protein
MSDSAQILDFAAYRARRGRSVAASPKRFLWGVPGQMMMLVEFPDRKPSVAGRLGSAQSPRG